MCNKFKVFNKFHCLYHRVYSARAPARSSLYIGLVQPNTAPLRGPVKVVSFVYPVK